MANPHVGELSFDAGGKTYTLHYRHGALVELEEILDQGIVGIMNEVQGWKDHPDRMRLKTVRAILWAGLLDHHPQFREKGSNPDLHEGLESVGDLMVEIEGGVGAVMAMTGEAMARAFRVSDETKGANPRKRQRANGIGKSSLPTTPR